MMEGGCDAMIVIGRCPQPFERRKGCVKDDMPTGKVRIFELAKELGLSSKDLIGLFGRLGLEAKNQLSVVDAPDRGTRSRRFAGRSAGKRGR